LRAEGATVADLREAVALPAAPKQPQPDDFDDAETLEREPAARLAARHERTGGPPPSEHLVAAQLAIEMVRLCTERAGHAALSSRASTSPPGARSMRPQRRTRLAHGSRRPVGREWRRRKRWEWYELLEYELLRDGGKA
jgi:hypothetical protein